MHSINVHNLIQQIENHPQRQALQSDLQQHQAFNPFSEESKDAIMAAGNTELCEIVDVTRKLVYSVHQLFICGMNLSKNLMQKITIVELDREEEVTDFPLRAHVCAEGDVGEVCAKPKRRCYTQTCPSSSWLVRCGGENPP